MQNSSNRTKSVYSHQTLAMTQTHHSDHESDIFCRQTPTCQQTIHRQTSGKQGALFLLKNEYNNFTSIFPLKIIITLKLNSPHKDNVYAIPLLWSNNIVQRDRGSWKKRITRLSLSFRFCNIEFWEFVTITIIIIEVYITKVQSRLSLYSHWLITLTL